MKIVSLIPSATEIVHALGLEAELEGVSHECDFPDGIRERTRVLVHSPAALPGASQLEIDRAVRETLERDGTLYVVDEKALHEIGPDLILTQELCQVCAPSGNEVSRAIADLPKTPEVLYLTPSTFEDVFATIISVGKAAGAAGKALEVVERLRARVAQVVERAAGFEKRSVLFLEWVDPVFLGGHWVHEGLGMAGGKDLLGPAGDSVQVPWEKVLEADPEILILGPCGFHLDRALESCRGIAAKPGWKDLRAVRNGKVFVVDADSYFARPGPRIVEGLELLAHLIRPEAFDAPGFEKAFAALET